MDRLRQDLGAAFRSLGRTRATTAIGVLALGLGIGANTALFSVANAFVFTPPPWRETEDLAVLTLERVAGEPMFPGVSFVEFEEWQATSRHFEGMRYIMWGGTRDVATGNRAERVSGSLITHEMIDLMGGLSPA